MVESTTRDGRPRDDPPSADEAVARLRLDHRDVSLRQLEEIEVVSWDREKHIVRKGPQFDEKRPA